MLTNILQWSLVASWLVMGWLWMGQSVYKHRAEVSRKQLQTCVVERATVAVAGNAIGRIKQIEEVYHANEDNRSDDDSLIVDLDGLW